MKFLIMLIRHDHPLPTIGVKLIVGALIDDTLAIRKVKLIDVLYQIDFELSHLYLVSCYWTHLIASTAEAET